MIIKTIIFKIIFSVFILVVFSISGFTQNWQYAKMFGGNSLAEDKPYHLEIDNYGNSYVFGNYGSNAVFNDTLLPHFDDNKSGAFLAKFDCNGEILWAKTIANSKNKSDVANYMIIKEDIIYLHGTCAIYYSGNTYFLDTIYNGSSSSNPYPPIFPWIKNNEYSYIIKTDLDGNIIDYCLFHLKDETGEEAQSSQLLWTTVYRLPFTIDNQDNIYLLTNLDYNNPSTLYINETAVTDLIQPTNFFSPMYIIKINNNFEFQWIKPIIEEINNPEHHKLEINIQDIKCDADNNIYLSGFLVSYAFNGGTYETPTNIQVNNENILHTYKEGDYVSILLKFNNNGNCLWSNQTISYNEYTGPTMSYSRFESIVLDEETNNVFVGGRCIGGTNSIPLFGTIFNYTDTLRNDYFTSSSVLPYLSFIASYDFDGNYNWVSATKSYDNKIGYIDIFGKTICGAVSWKTKLIHGLDTAEVAENNYNLSLLSWDFNGNPLEAITASEIGMPSQLIIPYGLKHMANGDIILDGIFDKNMSFGDNNLITSELRMFNAKYGSPCPFFTTQSETLCYGDEYLGLVLTQSGIYNIVLESSLPDIDSIISLDAEVLPELSTGIPDTTICANETYHFTSNNYYDSFIWSTGSQSDSEEIYYEHPGIYSVYVTITDDVCSWIDTITFTVDICNATDNFISSRINIYPQPANYKLNIQLPNKAIIDSYQIYSVSGQLIKEEYGLNNKELNLIIDYLETGLYLGKFQSNNQQYHCMILKE